jgi:hypothetical protein
MRRLFMQNRMRINALLWSAAAWLTTAGLNGQTPAATFLRIDIDNYVPYHYDVFDESKFTRRPGRQGERRLQYFAELGQMARNCPACTPTVGVRYRFVARSIHTPFAGFPFTATISPIMITCPNGLQAVTVVMSVKLVQPSMRHRFWAGKSHHRVVIRHGQEISIKESCNLRIEDSRDLRISRHHPTRL